MADDKFILMGLDDERSKQVAEILGNKTCKKIIDYLSEVKEASEQDISKALNIPLNTAEYNLNKLIKSGLVEKTKNFFWSVKGRKIGMFKLAKKHIIISPSSKRPNMNLLKTILPVILIAAILVVILSGVYLFPKQNIITEQDKIKQFASQEDLTNFIKENSDTTGYSNMFRGSGGAEVMMEDAVNAPTAAAGASEKSSASASDYSTTNIQVEGVDEADIVKNDDKYIYVVNGNNVKIIDAYPAEDMEILSEINVSDSIGNIFVNKDKLIVFGDSYNYIPYKMGCVAAEGVSCGGGYSQKSSVYIYDILDRENPQQENKIEYEGNYIDSRMIGDYVYVISTKYVNIDNPEPPVYTMNGVEKKISASDVYYWPYQDTGYVFTSIMAVDIENQEVNSKIYLTGSTNTIFVSQDNIYLTYQKTTDYKEYAKKLAESVYYPILSDEYDDKIKEVLDSDKNNWEKLSEMQEIVNDYGNSLEDSKEISDFSSELMKSLGEFNIEIQKETEKTVVHKINVDKNNIDYKGVGEVPGRILNQFSMDEYNNYFRIATTTGNWGETSLNHLYVLDKDLKIIGSVEDLAQGEKIYSTRFIGNRAYMVTFKSIDPLFVIDLKNPENPEVLGYLKIPGYSDYMHPYDENHIIGIGKDVNESIDADKVHSSDAVYYTAVLGLKISLFDVSDVEHPIEESKFVVGDRGTDSPALYDHRAFLFNKEKNLLVLPVSVTELRTETNQWGSYDNQQVVFNGAYVFNVNLNEISLRGKITHFDNKSKYGSAKDEEIRATRKIYGQTYTKIDEDSWGIDNDYYDRYSKTTWTDEYIDQLPGGINYNNFYDSHYQIQRSLYMDDVLYTVSQSKIKANDLNSVDEINSVDLGYEEQDYPIYYAEDSVAF